MEFVKVAVFTSTVFPTAGSFPVFESILRSPLHTTS